MAPEVVRREGHHFAADIWSVGCVIIEMLTGSPPWSNISRKVSDVLKILATTTTRPELPRNISKECRNFIQQCLQINPARRPTAADLLNHPFILNTKLPEGMDCDEEISSFPSNTSELRDFVPLTLNSSSRLCNIEDNQHSGSDRLSSLNVIDENVQSGTTSASTNARHLLETLDSPATCRGRFLLEPLDLPESKLRLRTPLIDTKYDERFARDSSSTNFSSYRNEKGEDVQEVKQVSKEKEMRRKRSKSKRTS
jgi:serine/threonine protein kinase